MRCKSSANINLKNKKGLWSPDEDQKLRDYILNHDHGCWSSVPINAGLQRNGKSCRLRWINYLRPGLKRGMFTPHEDQVILTLHGMFGNKWSQMSRHLPGRSDNEIRNHWHSYLKKKYANLKNVQAHPTYSDTFNEAYSSDSSLKPTRRGSNLKSSRYMEELSADAEPLDNLKEQGLRIPPKILFADWISLHQFHEFDRSGELPVSGDAFYRASISQKTIINGGSYGSEMQERSSMSSLQQSLEHQDVEYDFYNLIFEENLCASFNINDVKMYSYDALYSASTPGQSKSGSF